MITRRALLGGAAALGLARVVRVARAAPPAAPPKAPLVSAAGARWPWALDKNPHGVTVYARLAAAPYPSVEEPYSDDTVAIYLPAASSSAGDVDIQVHFHGHYNNVAHVLATQHLREQLAETGRAPLLVLPQLPFDAEDSSAGRLAEPGGLKALLLEVLELLQEPGLPLPVRPRAGARPGRIVLSAHSGGYKAASLVLRAGGLEVSEVWLFDGLFGGNEAFLEFVRGKGHRLVSYHRKNTKTADQTQAVMDALTASGIPFLFEKKEGKATRAEVTRARAMFVRTEVAHNDMVWAGGALADCLRSSMFPELAKPTGRDSRRPGKPPR